MSANHTPGPWLYTKEVNYGGMRYVRQAPEAHGSHEICRVEGWKDGVGEANARLIATAPELLAALEAFVQDYLNILNSGDNGTWDPMIDPVYVNACAAINKAKGQQS